MRKVFLLLCFLFPLVAQAVSLPRAFGKLKFGMIEAQVTALTGADFSSWCASCPADSDETSIKPEHFALFTSEFPGLTPSKWMPNDAIVLLTTKGKLSAIILSPEEKDQQILLILRKRFGEPSKIHANGTAEWRDSKTIVQCDFNTVRIYDRKAFPDF